VSPLVGFNDNIQYGGSTYHVQTEDSGPRRPHVITHLFADGGRIVTSQKTSYQELLEAEDADSQVRELMRGQHKAMLAALQTGEFDELLGDAVKPQPRKAKPSAPESPAPAGEPAEPGPVAGAAADSTAADRAGAAEREPTATTDQAAPLPLTAPVGAAATDPVPEPPTDDVPSGEMVVTEISEEDLDIDSEREAVRTKIGRRKPTTAPEVVPPVGDAVPVAELEKAAEEADRGFYRGIQPTGTSERGTGKRARKPTPLAGAGAYRFVANEGEGGERPEPEPEPADTGAPPRRRRYPQTSPGRRKAALERANAEAERRAAAGRRLQFGERFMSNRSLDKIILEHLSQQRSS
jgi:hypothetical protein